MLEYDWRQEMYDLAREDPWCKECLAHVAELEPGFLRLRDGLNPEEQAVLNSYIDACEEASFSLIYPAYRLGKCHGIRGGGGKRQEQAPALRR